MLATHTVQFRIGFAVAAILLCCSASIASAVCTAPPSGLTGWWPGNNATTDVVAGRNATLHNGATYGTGKVGQAFQFDGNNDDASVADAAALDVGTGNFTVDFWVKPNVEGGEQVMVEKWDEGTNAGWTLADRGGLYFAGSGNSSIQTSTQIVANTWTHIALRRTSGTVSVFHNGSLIQSTTANGNFDTSVPLLFGRRRGGQGFFWNGLVDEIHYFVGTALTNGQILAIYNAGSDGVCPLPSCGDGMTEGAEQCDDANAINGDGCDNNCTFSVCGNGVTAGSEACDDGNGVNGDGCDTDCTISCGNGVTTPPEACDDGNLIDGDGCNNDCTVTPACATAPSGLTGWWPGNNATTDVINGRNATLHNGATYASGKVGQAFQFDGADDDASVADAAALDVGTGNFTVDFWVKPSAEGGTECMVEKWDEGSNTGWTLCERFGGLFFAGSGSSIQTTSPIVANTWSHIALRRSSGTVSVFLNGAEIQSTTDNGNFDTSVPLLFGRRRGGQGFFWHGMIDEIHYFVSAALTNAEILAIYNAGSTGLCPVPVCGNGTTDGSEQCDDANAINGDGCDNNCTFSGCGNGITAGSEACDDGNGVNGDGCDTNCTISCGNGVTTPPEACDDGNAVNGDGCDINCTISCGNGVITPPEECDDGNGLNGDGCDTDCTISCGNGVITPPEACDDGNPFDGDGCNSDCTVTAPCAPIPVDLTAWWPGDGGTADIQGGFNAVARNGAGYGIGRVRQAFNLDGTNDFIDVPDDPGIDVGAGDFTVDLWVRFNDTAGEQVLIEKYVEVLDENSSGWSLTKLDNNSLRLATGAENADSHRLALAPDTWTHFAARRSTGTLAVFVNGVLVADAPAVGDLSSPSSLKFGHRGSPFDTPGSLDTRGFFLNGRIDEVHLVVGRGLSDAEIQAISASGPSGLCAAPAVCGNGVIEAGEPCDDGNGVDGDGCETDCTPSCGNGTTDPGEDCDDGNGTEGDGCDSNCSVSACGNGVIGGSETCEDGNSVNGDGCDNNCSLTECGNGIVTAEESCDDGDLVDGDGCDSDCTITTVEETAPPGGTVSTNGGTPEVPVQVALTTPGGGMVSIASSNEPLSPSTVQALVQSLLIEAPIASREAPLSIAIRIDASAIPAGLDLLHMTLTRDGVVLEDCIQPMIADPEPCIESRVLEGDGDVTITGLTAHASLWTAVAHGLFKAEQKCVNLGGKAGLNVAKAQTKLNAGCIKLVAEGASTDPQACVLADSAGKVAGKKQKTIDVAAARCVPAPAFGFTTAAAINTATQDAALGLLIDLFGSNLNSAIVTDEDGAACQSKALKAAQKLFALNSSLFLSCQKAILKGDPTPIVSLAELSACFDSLAINAKRLKTTSKLGKAIVDKCGANVATLLPGNCGAAINPAYCLATRIGCRTCQTVNAATDLGRDCDLFDDFMANGSCN